jgi:hypothetical protein
MQSLLKYTGLLMWLLVAVYVGLIACVPLQITDVKIMRDECDCVCLSWQTNQEAICKVTYCTDGMCYTSGLEPEYSTLHSFGLPVRVAKDITITAIGKNGQAVSLEIK